MYLYNLVICNIIIMIDINYKVDEVIMYII